MISFGKPTIMEHLNTLIEALCTRILPLMWMEQSSTANEYGNDYSQVMKDFWLARINRRKVRAE